MFLLIEFSCTGIFLPNEYFVLGVFFRTSVILCLPSFLLSLIFLPSSLPSFLPWPSLTFLSFLPSFLPSFQQQDAGGSIPWSSVRDASGYVYFYNTDTGETTYVPSFSGVLPSFIRARSFLPSFRPSCVSSYPSFLDILPSFRSVFPPWYPSFLPSFQVRLSLSPTRWLERRKGCVGLFILLQPCRGDDV